jgi:hypothetical protein
VVTASNVVATISSIGIRSFPQPLMACGMVAGHSCRSSELSHTKQHGCGWCIWSVLQSRPEDATPNVSLRQARSQLFLTLSHQPAIISAFATIFSISSVSHQATKLSRYLGAVIFSLVRAYLRQVLRAHCCTCDACSSCTNSHPRALQQSASFESTRTQRCSKSHWSRYKWDRN